MGKWAEGQPPALSANRTLRLTKDATKDRQRRVRRMYINLPTQNEGVSVDIQRVPVWQGNGGSGLIEALVASSGGIIMYAADETSCWSGLVGVRNKRIDLGGTPRLLGSTAVANHSEQDSEEVLKRGIQNVRK